MKLVRKLVPVDFLDMHGIENWLEDMAAKGLFFTGMGSCFARFRRGRPMPIRTRRRECVPPAHGLVRPGPSLPGLSPAGRPV
ncbi:hypothetical protein ACQRBP_05725 [Eubacteriales bacterium SGI.150]